MRKLCLIVGILLATIMPTIGQTLPKYLRTTFLKPGAHLEPVRNDLLGGYPNELFKRLRLSGSVSRRINYLGDLQGAVNINTPQKALDYVRLMTSSSTYFLALWPRVLYTEVMDRNQAKRMSNYELLDAHYWQEKSEFMGTE